MISTGGRDRLDERHEQAGGRLRQAGIDDDRLVGSDDRRLADDPRPVARLEPVHAGLNLGGGPPLPPRLPPSSHRGVRSGRAMRAPSVCAYVCAYFSVAAHFFIC